MASERASICEHKGWGTVPHFIYFYSRTQKLQFNIPRTYLCLIIHLLKLAYLLPLTNIGLFKWNLLAITSFSLFNNLVIYLAFLFNGSIFQRLKVSRPIILAGTHFYMHFGV